MAMEYEIVQKVKVSPLDQARRDDFVLREKGQVDSAVIVQNPHLSLYTLDFVNDEAVFVETPPEVDLCLEQFYYIAQYEHALRVIGVPLEEMISLSRDLPLDDQKLVFIHSTGRAGSTLASQIFAQLDGVANISEPDALTDLVAYRHFYPDNKAELNALANSVVRLLCQVKAPGGHVIKGRSFAIEIGDILYDLFPAAKIVFLYRDAKSYMLSSLRAYDDGIERSEAEFKMFLFDLRAWAETLIPLLADVPDDQWLSPTALVVYAWLSPMYKYVKLFEEGVPMLAIDYDSWLTAPQETAVAMLDYCGMAPPDLAPVYAALDRDSQAGTVLSRNAVKEHRAFLDLADPDELNELLATHPLIKTADFVAPNTLGSIVN
jgi:hypothetical protein